MKPILKLLAGLSAILVLTGAVYQFIHWFSTVACDAFSCLGLLILAIPIILFLTILLGITLINLIAFFIHKMTHHEN